MSTTWGWMSSADDITELIGRATAARLARVEKGQAFGEIVRRYQGARVTHSHDDDGVVIDHVVNGTVPWLPGDAAADAPADQPATTPVVRPTGTRGYEKAPGGGAIPPRPWE